MPVKIRACWWDKYGQWRTYQSLEFFNQEIESNSNIIDRHKDKEMGETGDLCRKQRGGMD